MTLFGTLVVGEGFPYTDMDLFNHALIGDLHEDTYAEAEMTEDGRKIRWSPHEINEKSFYSDDIIETIAILDAIVNHKDYGETLKKYINDYRNYKPDFTSYFKYP